MIKIINILKTNSPRITLFVFQRYKDRYLIKEI